MMEHPSHFTTKTISDIDMFTGHNQVKSAAAAGAKQIYTESPINNLAVYSQLQGQKGSLSTPWSAKSGNQHINLNLLNKEKEQGVASERPL